MWDYTEQVMDHFRHPRNVGLIRDPDGVGEVGSLACGDALKLMFKLDENGRIADVKFQTFGCASAIASSSALTEMIKGMTLEEAEQVTNKEIAEFLGGLPDQKMHCSVMGKEALDAAIEYYRSGGKTTQHELEGKIICTCFGVTEKEIERAIQDNGLRTVDDVTNYTKAGGGCGGCQPEIQDILDRIYGQGKPEVETPESKPKRLTNIEKIRLIQETFDREIRPLLRKDGGDVELVDIDGERVLVSLRGSCANCRVAQFTLRDVVQAKLQEFVSPELMVEEVS